mmetsp:Transcript_41355/g.118965  ORF Transcript_41355/g.118965 Transcript_41355/m.118965 type:complete len:374 (-) Transcript_41355:778-1899(-)
MDRAVRVRRRPSVVVVLSLRVGLAPQGARLRVRERLGLRCGVRCRDLRVGVALDAEARRRLRVAPLHDQDVGVRPRRGGAGRGWRLGGFVAGAHRTVVGSAGRRGLADEMARGLEALGRGRWWRDRRSALEARRGADRQRLGRCRAGARDLRRRAQCPGLAVVRAAADPPCRRCPERRRRAPGVVYVDGRVGTDMLQRGLGDRRSLGGARPPTCTDGRRGRVPLGVGARGERREGVLRHAGDSGDCGRRRGKAVRQPRLRSPMGGELAALGDVRQVSADPDASGTRCCLQPRGSGGSRARGRSRGGVGAHVGQVGGGRLGERLGRVLVLGGVLEAANAGWPNPSPPVALHARCGTEPRGHRGGHPPAPCGARA